MMKKNKMMRLASFLLVAVLLSTCAISGTFAKYVTSADVSDSARVAKWGVTVTVSGANNANGGESFKNTYEKDDADTTITNTVVATVDVIAPGTDGILGAATVAGKPEVAVEVAYTGSVALTGTWADSTGAFYCPLVIKINDTAVNTSSAKDATEWAKAVNDAITTAGVKKEYDTSTDLSILNDATNALITWEWPFETSSENNVKDTYLGNLAADDDTTNDPAITLTMTATVTQID